MVARIVDLKRRGSCKPCGCDAAMVYGHDAASLIEHIFLALDRGAEELTKR